MDPLSAAASVLAVVETSSKVISLCRSYWKEVKDAENDIQRLLNEIETIHDLGQRIDSIQRSKDAGKFAAVIKFLSRNKTTEKCRKELEGLEIVLRKGCEKPSSRWVLSKFRKNWRWPLDKKDMEKVVGRMEKYGNVLQQALTIDVATTVATTAREVTTVADGVDAIHKDTVASHDRELFKEIMEWLPAIETSSNHEAARKRYQPGTGIWLTEKSTQFSEWKTTPGSNMVLHGIPGCGKTVLCSTIVEHMKEYCRSDSQSALIYFYFDFNSERDALKYLSTLIRQMAYLSGTLPECLKMLFENCKKDGSRKPSISELGKLFKDMVKNDLASFNNIFIITDALDESSTKEEIRNDVLGAIRDIAGWKHRHLHFLFTSRLDVDIGESLRRPLLDWDPIRIEGEDIQSDIDAYISTQISEDWKLNRWSEKVKSEMKAELARKAQGMFRWVYCQIYELRKCMDEATLRAKLSDLPRDLPETYARILAGISGEHEHYARNAIIWLVFLNKCLTVQALAEAATIDVQQKRIFNVKHRLCDPKANLCEILGSLVVVETVNGLDGIRFAHFSVKEYLLRHKERFCVTETDYNTTVMAARELYVCGAFKSELQKTEERMTEVFHLLWPAMNLLLHRASNRNYHSNNTHAQPKCITAPPVSIYGQSPKPSRALGPEIHHDLFYMLTLFKDELLFDAFLANGLNVIDLDWGTLVRAKGAGPLHWTCMGNSDPKMTLVYLKHGADIEARDDESRIPLHWAARWSLLDIVRCLLEQGADVNAQDLLQQTPIQLALFEGVGYSGRIQLEDRSEIVRLLLEFQAGIDANAVHGERMLLRACELGEFEMVRQLLEAFLRTNGDTLHGGAPLLVACAYKRLAIVDLMVESGLEVNVHTQANRFSPLHFAAWAGWDETLRTMIAKGADVHAIDFYGNTALHVAAARGNEVSVSILLDHGADVNAKSEYGMTALHYASSEQKPAAIWALLQHTDRVYARDSCGRTPLHFLAYDFSQQVPLATQTDEGMKISGSQEIGHPDVTFRPRIKAGINNIRELGGLRKKRDECFEGKGPCDDQSRKLIMTQLLIKNLDLDNMTDKYGNSPSDIAKGFEDEQFLVLLQEAQALAAEVREKQRLQDQDTRNQISDRRNTARRVFITDFFSKFDPANIGRR